MMIYVLDPLTVYFQSTQYVWKVSRQDWNDSALSDTIIVSFAYSIKYILKLTAISSALKLQGTPFIGSTSKYVSKSLRYIEKSTGEILSLCLSPQPLNKNRISVVYRDKRFRIQIDII